MKDTTAVDYVREKRICKNFEIINIDKYHDLYVQSDTSLLADVLENFWNMCVEKVEKLVANLHD